MRLRAFEWLSRGGRRLIWGGALLTLLVAAGTTAIGDVTDEAKRSQGERPESFGLFAGPTAVLTGNQLQCGLVSAGEVCKDVFDSPTGNGGFWPTGSPNGYIFNTGLQIAGIIGDDGGPWANDTVAGYFFDARGNQRSGTSLTDIFVSTDADDAAAWPEEARVTNTLAVWARVRAEVCRAAAPMRRPWPAQMRPTVPSSSRVCPSSGARSLTVF